MGLTELWSDLLESVVPTVAKAEEEAEDEVCAAV